MSKRRNSQRRSYDKGHSRRNGRRNGNGNGHRGRAVVRQFEPTAPDVIEFVPVRDEFLCVGKWDESNQWSDVGRSEENIESEIFRSYEPDDIPFHVLALVAGAQLYLEDDGRRLSPDTKARLETFVSDMANVGYQLAA